MPSAPLWRDGPDRYGRISRALHWIMAALLGWQFLIAAAERLAEDAPAVVRLAAIGPGHAWIGVTVLALLGLRLIWTALNRNRRPGHPGPLGRAARVGQGLMYLLMAVVPSLALLRAYGSGRGWPRADPWLIPATGTEVSWMVQLGQALHGELAWLLFALILGHVGMAIWHHRVRRDGTLSRMLGRR